MSQRYLGAFDQVPKYRCDMAKAYGPACRELERQLRKKRGTL